MSVGYGALPDNNGLITLDASIMDGDGNCGAVAYMQNIRHAISVARRVMDKTGHIMLAGKGAEKFAISQGFIKEDLLTKKAKEKWLELKVKQDIKVIGQKSHDTITMIVRDKNGDFAGGCSTSGTAHKIHGRVGDSPIIGAGLYIDNEFGGAGFTGRGEECMRICGSHLIVELMRIGLGPQDACIEAIVRIARRHKELPDYHCAFIAVNKNGEIGALSLKKGFVYAVMRDNKNELYESEYLYDIEK
jgi:N4-(beta-N-acetylglucosaminyl)-L-asparaginase